MAIFAWLQRFINYFLEWIGIVDTDISSWDDLSTQYNLLQDEIAQTSYFTSQDKEILPIPIDSFVLFPKHLWIRRNFRQFCVVDDILYSSQQSTTGWQEDTLQTLNIYKSSNLVNFEKINRKSRSSIFFEDNALSYYGVKIIKYGDYFYSDFYAYTLDESRTFDSWQPHRYSSLYSDEQKKAYGVKCQTLFGDKLIQLMDMGASENGLFVNGERVYWNIPYFMGNHFWEQSMMEASTAYSFYNTVPYSLWDNSAIIYPYRKFDIDSGNYLYIMYNDILYQYNEDIVLENIYHVPFINFGMFYMGGSLYFRTRTGAVKCSLT